MILFNVSESKPKVGSFQVAQETFEEKQEESISIHIFSVSAAMVGVCLTVIGIFNIISSFKNIETFGDDITALDALMFLGACVVSYIAIRTKPRARRLVLEKVADALFLIGLGVMVVICFFIVFALNQTGG